MNVNLPPSLQGGRPYAPKSHYDPMSVLLGQAYGASLDSYLARRTVVYLVERGGLEPGEATERAVLYQRMTYGWGFIATPTFIWATIVGNFAAWKLAQAFAAWHRFGIVKTDWFIQGTVAAIFTVTAVWGMLVALAAAWRHCARGVPEVDARPWWRLKKVPSVLPGWKQSPGYRPWDPLLVWSARISTVLVGLPVLLIVASAYNGAMWVLTP